MGSVKDLTITESAYENRPGLGHFVFSDRYSVFDWGKMPDSIVKKGKALAVMAAFNFEKLEDIGVKIHYRGLVTPQGKVINFSDLKEGSNGSNMMQIDMGVVYCPVARQIMGDDGNPRVEYDYSFFEKNRGKLNNYLLGFEIIFRNALPKGSSVFKKIARAKKIKDAEEREQTLQTIYQKLGLKSEPKPGDMLPKPVINFTTKLEPGDRSLNWIEAYEISGLPINDFMKVAPTTLKVNDVITEQAKKTGFVHCDGKVEMLFNNDLVVADVIGTLDENRFGFRGEQVSKEVMRQWYEKNQPEFRTACDEWKKTGKGWQERCPVKPIHLKPTISSLVSQMYMSACNQYTERNVFDVPPLEEVMDSIRAHR
ncbi:MAG: phosphoribosylaminoimidazolesuccinocarboxamide synthase [Candidatus Aenigmarchaeota archaeon]|nr:phosphoribosylaminoimidazolesuccinocarboxamide synthase [Candidatus Aenigmarchaeota archaeon]